MTTSRQKLISYLRTHRAASAREMARALDTTAANVRHHLAILLEDGRVEVSGERREGRGRPVRLYSLSGALAGDNLPGLLDAALSEWLAPLPEEERARALEAAGRRLAEGMRAQGGTVSRRLAAAVENLSERHYAARWEAGAEGPHLILGRCPYAAVIARHPELCRMDAALLSEALGTKVRQRSKLQPACVFLVG